MATKTPDLKARRVEAKITRKSAADAAGISQFKLDKIERGADGITDDDRKAYETGLAKLLAEAATASTTNGTKPQPKAATAKKTTTRTRKTAQTAETAA